MSHSIKIAVVEDNPAYARSIQEVIRTGNGMECTGVYYNTDECSSAFQGDDAPEADVVLLDLNLPGKGGLTLVPILKSCLPDINILVLTHNDDYRTVLEAIQLGVAGYILKDAPIVDIRRAIVEVNDGGSVIDPQLSRLVLKAFNNEEIETDNPLTKREVQVLEFMALGYVKKEVADKLGISYSAVALYTANIYEKLQVPNIAAAVGAAIRKGLI